MIYRAEPNALMLFNAKVGITAAISGNELQCLKNHLKNGVTNGFIHRLKKLTILPVEIDECERQNMLTEIERTQSITAPLRSLSVPESIHIDLTTHCPLNCRQCYKEYSQNHELSFARFTKIIDEAKDIGVFQIALGGGEPLTIKNLPEYVHYVTASGMACTITTSGYGLTPEGLEELKNSGIHHIQVSLNGSTEEINAHSRDGFAETISALKLLSWSNVSFGINWVARMDNVADFANIIEYAKKIGAGNINVLRYKPSSPEDYKKISLTNDVFYILASQIKKVKDIKVKIDSAFSNLICYLNDSINSACCGCGAGRRFMMIDPDGRFKPCSHLSFVSDEQSILDYWQHSTILDNLRCGEDNMGGECKKCRHLNVCGGCRAICENIYQNIDAGERNCPAYRQKE